MKPAEHKLRPGVGLFVGLIPPVWKLLGQLLGWEQRDDILALCSYLDWGLIVLLSVGLFFLGLFIEWSGEDAAGG